MKYISSRDKNQVIGGEEAIIRGISKEGGLFVPQEIPHIGDLNSLMNMDYRDLSFHIISKYFENIDPDRLREVVNMAYDHKFSTDEIVKFKSINNLAFMELYHGPTLAFKDMALSILPHLLRESARINKIDKEIVILTATSGDTGKAALEGFANVEGVKIIVFYPEDGVSNIQKLQMKTQEGDNTLVVGIRGNFDDAQGGVKNIFNDEELKKELEDKGYILSSANSINIGRLIPQIIYYVYGYLNLCKSGKIKIGEEINVAVPTGNFGNILAAYYSKKMGLPIDKLICASNENNVLSQFLRDKKYDKNRDLILTSSPSMDILVSSNLERLIYHLLEDDKLVKEKMEELNARGYYEIKEILLEDFYGDFSEEGEVKEAISSIFKEENYLMDTHTAVAYNVYKKYEEATNCKKTCLIASTASPYKFGEDVLEALEGKKSDLESFDILEELSKKTATKIPKNIRDLKDKEVRHENIIEKEDIRSQIKLFLGVE